MADKIYVSRQTISNWENEKNYPDIKSLVLMSEVFQVSLDNLVKGDLERMKKEIDTQEYAKFQKDSTIFTVLFIALLIVPIPLVMLWKWFGMALYLCLFGIGMYFAVRIEKYKKKYDIQTFKEIVAFTDGKSLDEIEKAHPEVFNILLQVLDDGRITDSKGNLVSFKNTIIIMTSNIGSNYLLEGNNEETRAAIDNELKNHFKPEFLNRIDEIIVFHALTSNEMKKIVGMMCKEVCDRAKSQLGITLHVRESVKKHIVETGTDQKYGARPLRRAVQNMLEDKLAEALLDGEIKSGDVVEAGISKKEIKFILKTTN